MTVIVSSGGEIIKSISAPAEVIELNIPVGCVALPDPPRPSMYFSKGEWVDLPEPPSLYHYFDYEIKQWVDPRSLDEIKAQKWTEIKFERDQLEFSGFEFEGNTYDSDQVSQGRIMGASSSGIDQTWTLADNTTVELSASQLQQLYAALQAHIANTHECGRIARQLIYEATSIEQVELITL